MNELGELPGMPSKLARESSPLTVGCRVRTVSEAVEAGDATGDLHRGAARNRPPLSKLHLAEYAFRKAVGGGAAGAIAMVMNGKSASEAFTVLYAEGGIGRFYQGIMWALILAPLARFGETAANEGVSALLADSGVGTTSLTALAAVCAAWWRIMISPIDMIKTEMQVNGESGLAEIMAKIEVHGFLVLYTGSFGIALGSIVAFYPFFLMHNFLQKSLPTGPRIPAHARNAVIGLCSSFAAVVSSNPIKVLKTIVQTSDVSLGYSGALNTVLADGGWLHGLILRGLATRLVADGLSAIVFTVLWRGLLARWKSQRKLGGAPKGPGHIRKPSKPQNILDGT